MEEALDIAVAITRTPPALQELYSEEARARARASLSFEVVADRFKTLLKRFQETDRKGPCRMIGGSITGASAQTKRSCSGD
jgi:hypothetical protein